MYSIYKITNLINSKIYIGKTIRNPNIRKSEHKQYMKYEEKYKTPLYNALRKYGIENFKFEVLEDNIPTLELLNLKEQQYIKQYNCTSHANGYNITLGGDGGITHSKLNLDKVKEIIKILSDDNNLQPFGEIGKMFEVSQSAIRSINFGVSWPQNNIKYPIRKYDITGLSINKQKYKDIIQDIQNSSLLLKDIALKYNISVEQICSINQGKYCYKDHPYYQGIYNGKFPIRSDYRIRTPDENFLPIFYEVIFTNDSMAKIGKKFGIEGNTIQCIANGIRRKNLTKNFLTPLRHYKEENQKIFKELYPNFKEGDIN